MRVNVDNFSYSQFELWSKSKKQYYLQYGLGEDSFSSSYMEKGRMLMIALEFGVFDDPDPLLPDLVTDLPRLEIFEEKIKVDFELSDGVTIPVISYLDCSNFDLSAFGEYKTGKHPWTQDLVNDSDQLLFYATMIFMKTGKIPLSYLTWVQTEESDSGEIYYTGNHWTWSRKFRQGALEKMELRIRATVLEIIEYQYEEVSISDAISNRYLKLKRKRDKLDARIKLIENEIKNQLIFNKKKYGVSNAGSFTLAQQKKYQYSLAVTKAENNIKFLKLEERAAGLEPVLSPASLRFTENKL